MATKLTLKELSKKQDPLSGGHRACSGCGCAVVLRQVMLAIEDDDDVVVGFATGCMEVVTTIYPYTAWRVPYIHNAFENVGATISGAEAAYCSLKRQGKIPEDKSIKFIAFGGDGGTFDIGLQSLSGAMERGHNMLYVCYDNEAYMNTGIQRSGATPKGAATSTTPAGKVVPGKPQFNKDLTGIMIAHRIPYVAQASPHNWRDLMKKVRKALSIEGPAFMNIIGNCNRGWRSELDGAIEEAKLAVETCYWPLFEVENGEWTLNYQPKEKRPVEDWLKTQGRFKHLFKEENKHIIDEIQAEVDKRWDELLVKTGNKE